MEADSYDAELHKYKTDEPRPQVKSQETQDDGYETSNSGEAARRKAHSSPEVSPGAPHAPPGPPLGAPPTAMAATAGDAAAQGARSPDEAPAEQTKEPDPDGESRMAGSSSVSNSPKRMNVNPDDSHSNLSPEASNSQSNSSLGTMRSNNQSFENPEHVNPRLLPPQEDSSSQSHERSYVASQNPFDMSKSLVPQFGQSRQDPLSFSSIKRETYDIPDAAHDLYPQYRRDDQYSRDIYAKYKRPENDLYGANNMTYGGFNMKRDPYEAMKVNQYDQSQQMYGNMKREQEEAMMGYNGIKRECSDDPYSFVDEDAAMCAMLGQTPPGQPNPGMVPSLMAHHMQHPESHMGLGMPNQQIMLNVPKKRGRKKKIKDENGMELKQEPGLDGILLAKPVKERKKHDRFNGMSEEEVARRTLPDHLAENLDIIIIGINPGLFAAYKGHHYAGPGNHFWKCLYLSGLTREQMSADEDYKLLHFGIGFTNMVQRATKGSADLTRREIKEGSAILLEKLQTYRPKVAVFNGKLIYEVFSGKKDFCFGKQPDMVHGTNTYMWVMPSSSARCAQLPRAADKVPFYAALKKFRDYLNGALHHIDEAELIFPDTTCRRPHEEIEIRSSDGNHTQQRQVSTSARRLTMEPEACETMILEDGTEVPIKKKRGRPKKIKLENGEVVPPTPRAPRQPRATQPAVDPTNGEPPKKKRGRPKKIRPEEQQFLLAQQQAQAQQNQQNLMSQPLPGMATMNSAQSMESQFMHQGQDYTSQALAEQLGPNSMLYQGNMSQATNPAQLGMGPGLQGPQTAPLGPTSSPYFQHGAPTMPQGPPSAPQDAGPTDMSQPTMQGAPPGTPGPLTAMQRQPGYGQSPIPYSQSPRPQNLGYSQSPRPQGYSQSPQRHQSMTPSYSNSPVPRPSGTPQPSQPLQSPYPQSPAQPNPQYSQTSPQRPQSQNHSYSSPVRNHPYSRSPIPQNNTPTYSQPQQSPMYAQSPVNSGPSQSYSQLSPASQGVGGYASHSPAPRFSQSPAPQSMQGHPYSRSPAPQGMPQNYSQSPAPSQVAPFPQHSPAIQGNSYTPSPANTPYSQHSSPAPNRPPTYGNSPAPQQPSNLPHHPGFSSPLHSTRQPGFPPSPSHTTVAPNPPMDSQQYGSDLSTEISAAISSPGPVSPSMGHIDFEPPIATNKIRVPETDAASTTTNPIASQENSPLGSTEMQPGSNSNSSVPDFNKQSSDNQNFSSRDEIGRMGGCTENSMIQQHQQLQNSNRHSALNLIGPPSSSASNISSPNPTMEGLSSMRAHASTPTYGTPIYDNMGSVQSPLQHEQRLGFQVPTPSGSGGSGYAQGPGLNLGVASPSPKPQIENMSSAQSHHERLANPYGYQGDQGSSLTSSPRLQEGGPPPMMSSHQIHQHSSPMYANPFNRVASTPPHHPLAVQASQASPFSSQGGSGAFRGLPSSTQQSHESPVQPASSHTPAQSGAGSPAEYGTLTKAKPQDVASKSLSGLESLVDQIPSIADGPASVPTDTLPTHPTNPTPVPPLPDPYAPHPPSLYNPYSPYQTSAYAPTNNTYPTAALTAGSFVGYPGNPYGQLMRPTPGYLPEALSPYHHHPHHSGYPGLPTNQYTAGAPGYPAPGGPPNYTPYYNGYGPPGAMQAPGNMPTYLSTHVLDHIHKNDAASSVSFGGYC